jgi:hypothetical protein
MHQLARNGRCVIFCVHLRLPPLIIGAERLGASVVRAVLRGVGAADKPAAPQHDGVVTVIIATGERVGCAAARGWVGLGAQNEQVARR